MGTRRGVVCELHDWSADSEFTELLKGRYITDIVDDEILVLDNGMWLHVETEDEGFKGGTFIQYLNVCGRNDARIMSAHLVDDYGEDPISLIERQTYTLFVMVNDMERPVLKIVREDAPYYPRGFTITAYVSQDAYIDRWYHMREHSNTSGSTHKWLKR